MNKRLLFLDYAKGFGIIALLFAHTMNTEEHYVGIWITSWFMPIFFVVSGIILQKKFGGVTAPKNIVELVKKRLFQLGVPYLFFGTLLSVFYILLSIVSGESPNVIYYLVRIITLKGIDSLWFIPCYFLTELLMCILLLFENVIGKVIRIAFLIFGIVNITLSIDFPFVLIFDCYVFTYFGYVVSKYSIIEKTNIFVALFLFIIGIPLAIFNGGVSLASLHFNYGYLYIINAVINSFAILAIFYYFEQKTINIKFLDFFGKNTIVVLCTNNLLIETIRLLDSKLTGDILMTLGIWGSIIFTIILIVIEAGIIKMSQSKLGVLFGKKRL